MSGYQAVPMLAFHTTSPMPSCGKIRMMSASRQALGRPSAQQRGMDGLHWPRSALGAALIKQCQ